MKYEAAAAVRASSSATGKKLGEVPKATAGWDDDRGVTVVQRRKEEASDYRYFPEPDLVPVAVDAAWLERVRAELGELPAAQRQRLADAVRPVGLRRRRADQPGPGVRRLLRGSRPGAAATPRRRATGSPTRCCRRSTSARTTSRDFPLRPPALADLIQQVQSDRPEHAAGPRGLRRDARDAGSSAEAGHRRAGLQGRGRRGPAASRSSAGPSPPTPRRSPTTRRARPRPPTPSRARSCARPRAWPRPSWCSSSCWKNCRRPLERGRLE